MITVQYLNTVLNGTIRVHVYQYTNTQVNLRYNIRCFQ